MDSRVSTCGMHEWYPNDGMCNRIKARRQAAKRALPVKSVMELQG